MRTWMRTALLLSTMSSTNPSASLRAVRPLGDGGPHADLRPPRRVRERARDRLRTELREQLLQPSRAYRVHRSGLRVQVADDQLRRAAVSGEELQHFLNRLAVAVEEHRWDVHPLAEYVARYRVSAARRLPADVALVPHRGAERDDLAIHDDGCHDDHVVGVRAAGRVRVGGEVTVAVLHLLVRVVLEDARDAVRVRAAMLEGAPSAGRRCCRRGR